MVKTREELFEIIKKYTKNSDDENVLKDVEDITDTINAMSDESSVDERIAEVEKKWHKKFIEKFFSSPKKKEDEEEEEEEEEKEKNEDVDIFIEEEE